MEESAGMATEHLPHLPIRDIAIFHISPMEKEEVDLMRKSVLSAKAVIFTVFASGTSPRVLNPLIRECTAKDIPVFLLSTNYANNTGIRALRLNRS